jgi:hypothetical protein
MITNSNAGSTPMSELTKILNGLLEKGFTEQFIASNGRLLSEETGREYEPGDIHVVNFYRFEGISDPDDMSILYAIKTSDGHLGTLIDAYGVYSDAAVAEVMRAVDDIHKQTPHD